MSRTKTIVTGAAAVSLLSLAACGGTAGGGVKMGGGATGSGMIAQLSFPSEADSSVGGLVNYNPLSPTADDQLDLRAPHRPQQPHLHGDPMAGHEGHVGGGDQAHLRHPRRGEVE